MAIEESIRQLAKSLGADLVGFADVSCLPIDVTDGMTRGVSVAVSLNAAVICDIAAGPTMQYFTAYKRANTRLNQISAEVVDMLRDAGHAAHAFPATTELIDRTTLATRLQHRTIATRAGLGWIGKSGLLVTEEYGAAIRLASILTDAPLDAAKPTEESRCADCRKCVEHCPAQAVAGALWRPGVAREHLYDAAACFRKARELAGRNDIKATICGICINICPWTQRYLARVPQDPYIGIASAATEDLDSARGLFREYEACLPFDLSFQNFEKELEDLPGRYAPPSGRLLLARDGETLVGCVALRQIGDDLCEMKRLFVRPESRRRGIGKALARAIVEEARRIGYKRMRLHTVLEPAGRLYESLGFREIPPCEQVPVAIEGVVFMELEL